MVITILAEARSGSTNLAHWFSQKENFTVFYEPLNPGMAQLNEYKGDTSPKTWKYDTKHLLIKELYGVEKTQLEELISITDKIILLYRENTELQEESFKMAVHTGNWDRKWSYHPKVTNRLSKMNIDWFRERKTNFKSEYLDNNSYFKISYEELYYNDGFQRIVDYIDLPEVQNIDFPYGEKYRVDTTIDKLI
jgi:hypothetical protein